MFENNNISAGLTNNINLGLYNSLSSIPEEILNLLNNASDNQPITNKSDMVDIFMRQKAQSELEFLKLGGIK